MKSMGLNEEQLQKIKTHPGFYHRGAGSKWWQHAKGAGYLRNQKRCMVQR